jgi:hypothetical protein
MTKAGIQLAVHDSPSANLEGAGRKSRSLLLFKAVTTAGFLLAVGCSLMTTRPVQEMSDTAAAIRAAREVQADTLAPELFRQSIEWFNKAKREYKFKNFDLAKSYSDKARLYAEDSEFEAIRNGGNRSDTQMADPMASGLNIPPPPSAPASAPSPYAYPTPQGIPADPSLGGPAPTEKAPSPSP